MVNKCCKFKLITLLVILSFLCQKLLPKLVKKLKGLKL